MTGRGDAIAFLGFDARDDAIRFELKKARDDAMRFDYLNLKLQGDAMRFESGKGTGRDDVMRIQ